MIKSIVNTSDEHALRDAIDKLAQHEDVQSIILYMAEHFAFDANILSEQLKRLDKTIIGGVFPEVILDGKRFSDSAILLGLPQTMAYTVIDEFDENHILPKVTEGFKDHFVENSTFFVFIDALVRNKTILFDNLYNYFGSIPNYLGGGTGTLSFEPTPCVVTNEGVLTGAALVACTPQKTNIGVAHGWSPISKPLKVTEVSNNEIISLDWKPVMEVYQTIVEEHSKAEFDYDDFFNTVKSYPIGIKKLNDNMTVRDPFKTENGRLFLLDDIEEGSYVQVLYGNIETLIDAARIAREKADVADRKSDNTLIIDCISRGLFMGEEFKNELDKLDPFSNSFGALTLGEIANNGDEYLDVYNKTAVVGIFE